MGDQSPPASGHWLCPELKPTASRAKRLSDSAEWAQALWAAKKACVLGSSPDPPEKLLLSSPGATRLQGSADVLDDGGRDDLSASSSAAKYDDVSICLDTTRCFGDSELDDSLLQWSCGEEGNSPLSCTEEEIQEILADDRVESQWHLARKSTASQNVNGESELEESSCTGTLVTSEEMSGFSAISDSTKEPLSGGSSSVCSEELWDESASLGENHLQSAQVTRMLFDLDIRELLSLSPIDADYTDQPLEEASRDASAAVLSACPGCDHTAGSCDLAGCSEEPMANGQRNPAVDCLGSTPSRSTHPSDLGGDRVESSTSSPDLSCGQRTAEESSAPVLPGCPTSPGSRDRELSKATKSCFSGKSASSKGDEEESAGAEEPSNSIQLSDTALGQAGQEETTSGKKPGKVIPVPQEEGERLKQWTRVLEAEPEPKKVFVNPSEEICDSSGSFSTLPPSPVSPKSYRPRRSKEITQGPTRNLPEAYTVGEHELGPTPLFPEHS